MIEYRSGDVIAAFLNDDVDFFAHGCNCFNTMGGGIARQVASDIPELYDMDQQTTMGHHSKLGTCHPCFKVKPVVKSDVNYKFNCFNLYTQYHFGKDARHLNYGAVSTAFLSMFSFIDDEMVKVKAESATVGIPLIGAGLAGGDWIIISEIIEHINNMFPNIVTVVYEFK